MVIGISGPINYISAEEGAARDTAPGDFATACSTPGRRPHRIRSFDETEALAQCLAGELLAVEGPALRELLRPGKGHCHRLEPCIAPRGPGRLAAGGIAIGSPARGASFS